MLLKNARLLTDDFQWMLGDLRIENGRIAEIGVTRTAGDEVLDCTGLTLVPGLVDIHTHGALGVDYSGTTVAELTRALRFEAQCGVTTVLPTLMTMTPEMISDAVSVVRTYRANPDAQGAWVPGIHLEGPFFSLEKCGAQPPEWIIPPDKALFDRWNADEIVKLIALAPETEGAMDFIRLVAPHTAVAIGHTNADYETACRAFEAGATDATHLYNAMSPASHRSPGVVGAVWDTPGITGELICDGCHVHPVMIRTAFALMPERIAMISDSLLLAGQPEGTCSTDIAGHRITIRDGRAELDSGTIAGCCVPLSECVRRAISFGVPEEVVFRAATLTPARTVRLDHEIGSLTPGKRADLLLLDPEYRPRQVWVGGRPVL